MKEFVEYDNGRNTIPYRASEICFCLTDYARNYINEKRVVTKNVDVDVRDAVLVDMINYLGMKGCIDFALYTKDLQEKCDNEYFVDPQCLITIMINHLSYYLFYDNPVKSIKLNNHMNSCKEEININDVSYVVVDFINYLLEVNGYERVFTLFELKQIADESAHRIEMRKLKDFLISTGEYSEVLSKGEDIVKLYRKVSSQNKLNYIDKNDVYHYIPSIAKKLGRSEMFSWDLAPVREKLYSMMYAYGKINPNVKPKNEALVRILNSMRTK